MTTRLTRPLLLCAFFSAAFCSCAFAASLDPRFGVNGQVAVELGKKGSRANAVQVQPDGKIVAAGSRSGEKDRDFMLFRLLPDGSLDPEFNQDGTVITAVSAFDDEALTLAVQADGKIIAAGYSSSKENRDFAMVRYNIDGSIDSGFGAAGMVVTAVGGSNDEITDVAVQADGKIILTGAAQGANGRVAVLARYLADGKPDPTFGEEGFTLSVVGVDAQAESVASGKDGRILLSGTYSDGQRRGLMLLGFDSHGRLDKEFGENGIAVPADSSVFSEGYGMTVNEDNTILVAGSVGGEDERDTALFRFTAEGQPDKEFENNGVLVSPAGPEDDLIYDVAVTEAGIAAAGFKTVGGQREFLLVTYTKGADGSLSADLLTTGFSSGKDTATALAAFGSSVVAAGESLDADDTAALKAAVSKYIVDTENTGHALLIVNGTAVETADADGVASGNQYVLTGEPSDVTRTTVVITGEVLSGAGDVTERGIVFGPFPNPSRKDKALVDEGAPVVTNNSQATVLGASASLNLTTNVDAACKYSKTEGTSYDQMENSFTTADGKKHSTAIDVSGFEKEKQYSYYARCKNNASGAVNTTDTVISFKVIKSGTAGTTGTTGGTGTAGGPKRTPSGLNISETKAKLQVKTDVDATCKYDTAAGTSYDDMEGTLIRTEAKTYSTQISDLDPGIEHSYYIRCKNTATEVVNTTDTVIAFKVQGGTDSGPVRHPSNINISETSAILMLTTDVDATCKYTTSEVGMDYSLMKKFFDTTEGKNHSEPVSNLKAGTTYSYYIRCKNTATDERNTTDSIISFSVNSDAGDETAAVFAPATDFLASSDQLINTALRDVGRFFISTAEAQVTGSTGTTGTTGTSTAITRSSSSNMTATATTANGDFIEAGYSSEGGGIGQFTSKLTKLKPGTVFYARAYAVIGGTVRYGNEVSFRTADSCFVATAAFGSVFHPAVQVLRDFRDQFLSRSAVGQAFVNFYYRTSPPLADIISQHASLRLAVRLLLLPVTGAAWLALHLGAAALLLPLGAISLLLGWQLLRRRNQGRAAIG